MIIVTGGAGFIGSNIIFELNQKGITDILVVDNLKNASKHLNLNALTFSDYIAKEDFFQNISQFKNIELVIHQGACSATTETDGYYMMKNNYEFSKNILDFCSKQNANLIYASSASVYGDGKLGFSDTHDHYFPLNVYAYSKLLFDKYVRKIIHEKKNEISITGLRYFNVYGHQENHKEDMASLPFKSYNQCKKNHEITLFEGSHKFLRDFIFVKDIVDIVMYFKENSISGIFNCGTGKARSFQDIADIIKSIYTDAEIKLIDFPNHLIGKYQEFTEAEVETLRQSGYKKDFTSLEMGIKSYLDNLEKNNGYLFQKKSVLIQ
jgi:ADP-L-glycero-D-manno-heptose 6-epimerase